MPRNTPLLFLRARTSRGAATLGIVSVLAVPSAIAGPMGFRPQPIDTPPSIARAASDEQATVVVDRSKRVRVVIAGQAPIELDLPAEAVSDVLEALPVVVPSTALVVPGRFEPVTDGMLIKIRQPVTVELSADGRTREVTTTAETVADLLDAYGLRLEGADFVRPALPRTLSPDDHVRLVRVTFDQVVDEITLPREVIERETADLERGETRVIEEGQDGLQRDTYRVTYHDGVEVRRKLTDSKRVQDAVTRIVEVGTRPSAVSGSQTGTATYYGCGDGFNGQRTANGEIYDDQAMTAAHRTLPFGTIVTVISQETGNSIEVRINDRGPFSGGHIIDLSCGAMEALAGRRAGGYPVELVW